MTNLAFFLGEPVKFKDICYVYPPKIKDTYQEPKFHQFAQAFTLSQEEIEDELLGVDRSVKMDNIPTPFQFLLNNCYHNDDYLLVATLAFQFFIHENVTILPEQGIVVIGDIEEIQNKLTNINDIRMINESNYFDFQNLIREALGQKAVEPPHPKEDIRVTRIKAKARYRDKIKAKSKKGIHFDDILVSICCIGSGISPLNIGELSYVAVNALIEKYQAKEKYEMDIQSLLAGADSKKIKPKYWMGNN